MSYNIDNPCNIEVERLKREVKHMSTKELEWNRFYQEKVCAVWRAVNDTCNSFFEDPDADAQVDNFIASEVGKQSLFDNEVLDFINEEITRRKGRP